MAKLTGEHSVPDLGERLVIVLGSTGSIGKQTLEVVAHINALHAAGRSPVALRVVGLAAGGAHCEVLAEQARRFGVKNIACPREMDSGDLPPGARVFGGQTSAEDLVRSVDCDLVVAAIVGIAGLPATLAAVQEGRDVALANKETLVAAGSLVIPLARDPVRKVCLLPVDSEHSALWQCLLSGLAPREWDEDPRPHEWCPPWIQARSVRRAVLTASGGPFRGWTRDRIDAATPAEALNHPTWRMGPKVTIDSASLMNKALEVIEAHWLFGLPADRIEVLVHPQSTVHAMVEFDDGSLVAQMAAPDMRTPIQIALTWPRRVQGAGRRVDLGAIGRLDFEPVDHDRFPALRLAYEVIARGGTAGAIFNAANEAAVRAFLAPGPRPPLPFGRIPELVEEALGHVTPGPLNTLEDVVQADRRAREFVEARLGVAGDAPVRGG